MTDTHADLHTPERIKNILKHLNANPDNERWCFATLPHNDDEPETMDDRLARLKEMSKAFESIDIWGGTEVSESNGYDDAGLGQYETLMEVPTLRLTKNDIYGQQSVNNL
ncbi:MAG: hypothetical protein LBR22_05150 [Desulfovibrio sp.]|jgi:hypothetical protein|nr:hypothetical protein [Desulfovibrio sp.]